MLEWLTEFKEPVYSLDYCFVMEGYNSGMEEIGQYTGEKWGRVERFKGGDRRKGEI